MYGSTIVPGRRGQKLLCMGQLVPGRSAAIMYGSTSTWEERSAAIMYGATSTSTRKDKSITVVYCLQIKLPTTILFLALMMQ